MFLSFFLTCARFFIVRRMLKIPKKPKRSKPNSTNLKPENLKSRNPKIPKIQYADFSKFLFLKMLYSKKTNYLHCEVSVGFSISCAITKGKWKILHNWKLDSGKSNSEKNLYILKYKILRNPNLKNAANFQDFGF